MIHRWNDKLTIAVKDPLGSRGTYPYLLLNCEEMFVLAAASRATPPVIRSNFIRDVGPPGVELRTIHLYSELSRLVIRYDATDVFGWHSALVEERAGVQISRPERPRL